MSISMLQAGLLAAGLVFLIGGSVFAVLAARIAAAGRAAQADAAIRLAASEELAVAVKRLAEKVEQSLAARDAAIENAFLRHNDACMASVQTSLAAQPAVACAHNGDATTQLTGDHHDADDHRAMIGAESEDATRPSFLSRLFRRYD